MPKKINFYESRPIVFMNQGRVLDVISEGVRFDRIFRTYSAYSDRQA